MYKAYDHERHADIALKSFSRGDIGSVYDLKREFRVLADLSHPNLVSLHELFEDEDRWFIAMELVQGVDILTYVRHGASSSEERAVHGDQPLLARVLPQLVDAVCYLHSRHKLHCDIKPSNVLITFDGRLKLLDFGLTTDVIPTVLGETVRIRGTPAYVAPEQASGAPASAASDWYSLGVLLFEALTGRRPFEGTFLQVLEAKQHQDAPAPASVCTDIPRALNTLCLDLLARHPTQRPVGTAIGETLRRIWPSARATHDVSPARRPDTPFIGRAAPLAALNDTFDRSTLGRPATIFVHGSSGMGKTALVRHFVEQVREREPEVVVLEGRCYERESVPYKALDSLVDTLSRYLRTLPRAEVDAILPRNVTALTRLFPILRRVDAVAEARQRVSTTTDPQELRRRGFGAFRELLVRLANRRPVVLVIDDLQWSDTDSAALIKDIIFVDEPPPILFVVCYRSEDAVSSTALSTLLATASAARSAATTSCGKSWWAS